MKTKSPFTFPGLCLLLSAFGLATLRADCVTTPLPDHWWQADGNASNAVSTAHGTVSGGVTYAPGRIGQAFRFDGIISEVSFGTNYAGWKGENFINPNADCSTDGSQAHGLNPFRVDENERTIFPG